MNKREIKNSGRKYLALALLFAFVLIFSLLVISADSSTSIYSAQYFPPSVTGQFSSLMSGPTTSFTGTKTGAEDEFFDMQLFIPPLGCQPYVVRSDLLEEQNVPVFCQLVPLKINPGIDITRIDSISVVQKESSPYVSGVGFHPAAASIKSKYGITGVPSGDNIGYVVVVLKRQEIEKNMPDNVTVILAARMSYGAENSFGIGKNEYLVPSLTDEEFANDYTEYEFYDGIGYLRAEDVDETGARISVYSSDSRVIFSERIEKGKISRDFYLPNTKGGQGIRLSLIELTIPETKARIKVNSEKFDVYNGQTFYNGKCRVLNLQALGLGAGTASIRCGSKNFELTRQINKINLQVLGTLKPFSIGAEVKSEGDIKYYLVYVNKLKTSEKSFVVIAKLGKDSRIEVNDIVKAMARLKPAEPKEVTSPLKINDEAISLITLDENDATKEKEGITFTGIGKSNDALGDAEVYFKKANDGYDFVNTNFGTEAYPESKLSYGEQALWSEYALAENLKQQEAMNQALSRIFNQYPASVYNGQSASSLARLGGLLASNPEAKGYDEKQDISVELISVNEPSEADASVSISYNTVNAEGKTVLELKSGLIKGDSFEVGADKKRSLTIESFDENSVKIKCTYKTTASGNSGAETLAGEKGKPMNFGKNTCDMKVYVEKINLKRVAKVQITPLSYGRSRESNFTFSIGIEKRALAMNLTPEQANSKMASLQKEIDKYKKISENLGKLIEGGKAACLATSAIINVKNLLAGRNGEASARTEVMKRWNEWCASSVNRGDKYANSEECIAGEYSEKIEPEITATAKAMSDYNTAYENLKNSNKLPNGATNDAAVKEGLLRQMIDLADDKTKTSLTKENIAYLSYYEVSKLYFDLDVVKNGGLTDNSVYNKEIDDTLKLAEKRKIEDQGLTSLSQKYPGAMALGSKNIQEARGSFKTWNDYKSSIIELQQGMFKNSDKVAVYNYANKGDYLVVLDKKTSNVYDVREVYRIDYIEGKKDALTKIDNTYPDYKAIINFRFIEEDATTYKNPCSNCNFMKVFALEPYKGQPALLPFDFENGFYVQVKNDFPGLGTGNVQSYQDSGRVNSFYLCNVGKNKLMEGVNMNDDTCRKFDFYTGDTLDAYPGLTKTQTKAKVQEALNALSSAQRQIASNPSASEITINRRSLTVRNVEGDSGSKCTDFMSPGDCQMIYNVCDPFVCPNSRCDFGGRYKVDNVIQSGIIGSTLLCMPNFILLPGNKDTGVIIPVCITGINAGLQGWISILESYRDCINESVTTGRTVGICDAIHSVYLCDFFWRQAGPFTSAIMKNLFLGIFGKRETGGGEYLFVNDAWNNAEKSAQYFQTAYAKDSKLSFGFDSIASSVVAEVCKLPVSATYPDKFKTMLEPEIPVQFHANFEELSYSSATVPATSQYNVFYHIYAGDAGHYFQIYLKSPPTAIGYTGKESTLVASGYVSAGQKASDTKNFIDTSGFKQLCVRIDAKEECGFKSVTTSFALDYAKDAAIKSQATTEVTSEAECVNGGQSLGAFLTPNIQQGVEEFINPELYNQGIIRVCSNNNPGEGTEPTRWKDVGYCTDRSLRCWIDAKSVKKAVQFKGIENQTLSEIDKINAKNLEADGFFGASGSAEVSNLKKAYESVVTQIKVASDIENKGSTFRESDYMKTSYENRKLVSLDTDVAELDKKLIFSKDRAELWFVKAKIYGDLAKKLYVKKTATAETTEAVDVPAVIISSYKILEIYTTKSGDSLTNVAMLYAISVNDLKNANSEISKKYSNTANLPVGTKLKIPAVE